MNFSKLMERMRGIAENKRTHTAQITMMVPPSALPPQSLDFHMEQYGGPQQMKMAVAEDGGVEATFTVDFYVTPGRDQTHLEPAEDAEVEITDMKCADTGAEITSDIPYEMMDGRGDELLSQADDSDDDDGDYRYQDYRDRQAERDF